MPKEITRAKRKARSLIDRFSDFMAYFLGSWWAIIFHTAWFTVWLILNFDVNLLTFGVSLEAIFIGIFLLMSANKAEIRRDLREALERGRDRERLERDIKLDERADRQLVEIRRSEKKIQAELEIIRKKLDKLVQ